LKKENDPRKILSEFMNNASPEEIRELERLLERKRKSRGPLDSLDPGGAAKNMARDIQRQIGFTQENVRRTAVDMVVRLAKQHQPDISDAELRALVSQMVPGANEPDMGKRLPPEILKEMVTHYVLFRTGRMTGEELKAYPEGWHSRYWRVFPPGIKKSINRFLSAEMEPREFWSQIERDILRR
jgi:hypothetical protein